MANDQSTYMAGFMAGFEAMAKAFGVGLTNKGVVSGDELVVGMRYVRRDGKITGPLSLAESDEEMLLVDKTAHWTERYFYNQKYGGAVFTDEPCGADLILPFFEQKS